MFRLPDTLTETLSRHLDLSKSRLETFATLIIGCVCARTVNLSHIASQFDTSAQVASNYRRLQRFFQYVRLDQDWLAHSILALLGTLAPYTLCLDRTNWKIGRRHINLLVLCVVARRVRIPILWTVLDKAGTCNLRDRRDLMTRTLRCIAASSIRILLADREFIGHQWFDYLIENKIPFAIRLKQDLLVRLVDGRVLSLASLFNRHKSVKHASKAWQVSFLDSRHPAGHGLWVVAKRLRDKDRTLLIVATTLPDKGMALYRKRWQIECLFGDTKTRGLNLEDTRLTDPAKLSVLIAVVAFALLWAHLCATHVKGLANVKRASHGYRRKSWFRTGFDALRGWIINDPTTAATVWQQRWKLRKSELTWGGVV